MTDLFTSTELEARQILATAQADEAKWSSGRQVAINTFRAMYWAALSVDKIVAVGNAMNGTTFTAEAIRPFLTALVREKVLRSRRINGTTHYEIALAL